MLKKQNLLLLIFLAIILVGLVSLGGFVYSKNQENSNENLNNQKNSLIENFSAENSATEKISVIENQQKENSANDAIPKENLKKNNDGELLSKIDQIFIIGFRGYALEKAPDLKRALAETNLGGVILFDYDSPTKKYARNIQSAEQVKKLISSLQTNSKTPLFVAVDEEGGKVSRLKNISGFTKNPSAKTLGKQSTETVFAEGQKLGAQLKNFGFNIDFAPVLDTDVNPENPVIGKIERSFSSDPKIVAEKGIAFMKGLQASESHLIPVGKHFPGHGSSKTDSHLGFVDITNTYKSYELEPFRDACTNGLPAIMIAHVYNKNVDSIYPATLSKKHLEILKNKIDCKNQLVISDDLDMEAITKLYSREEALVLAINAGVDVIVISNNIKTYDPEAFFKARQIVLSAVKDGEISKERIEQIYEKIMKFKANF